MKIFKLYLMNLLLNMNDPFFDVSGEPWMDFLTRLTMYVVSLFILVRFIFYPNNGQSKYIFVYFISGLMIFLIASTLDQVNLNMGIAFGLFAIFGIIRYRTPSIELKEMTYLLVVIGMAAINGLVEFKLASWAGLLIANLIMLVATFGMEIYQPKKIIAKKTLVFTLTNYQALRNNSLMLNEIKKTTAIDAIKAEVLKINKTKNEVTVMVTYRISDDDSST